MGKKSFFSFLNCHNQYIYFTISGHNLKFTLSNNVLREIYPYFTFFYQKREEIRRKDLKSISLNIVDIISLLNYKPNIL